MRELDMPARWSIPDPSNSPSTSARRVVPRKTNPFQQVIASLLDLLENGCVVTESIEYPDPQARNPREVDITIVRGQLNGQELKIRFSTA
ncbi:hypothetical protein [Mycobacterium sp. 852002-50816_SCH5313054-b]|uniref:hypothetical protein n=1 Tax=Mycobacterium sp. 852002-50816_SCH5313054-b TaxID=1834092 RepID=UPI000B1AFDFD|nr:hypothetical protein [Mycobacterium sp. 852002-50816_SCH5313054-b]